MMEAVSGCSGEICERILQLDLHADMLSYLDSDALCVATLHDVDSTTSRRQFVDSLTGILYNVLARSDSAAQLYRQCQAFRILQKLRDDVVEPSVISVYFKRHGTDL